MRCGRTDIKFVMLLSFFVLFPFQCCQHVIWAELVASHNAQERLGDSEQEELSYQFLLNELRVSVFLFMRRKFYYSTICSPFQFLGDSLQTDRYYEFTRLSTVQVFFYANSQLQIRSLTNAADQPDCQLAVDARPRAHFSFVRCRAFSIHTCCGLRLKCLVIISQYVIITALFSLLPFCLV